MPSRPPAACAACEQTHRPCTARQDRFCELYLVHGDATRSAVEAGYSGKTAAQIGYQLLHKTSVACRLAVLRQDRSAKSAIDAEGVLRLLTRMATYRIGGLYDGDGKLRPVHEWPEELQDIVLGLEAQESDAGAVRVTKVKLPNKLRATELLARRFGLFEKSADSGREGLAARLLEARIQVRGAAD